MKDYPPTTLLELLPSLGLVSEDELCSVGASVQRLAGEVPPLEALWLDALVEAGMLTTWQAVEIGAGRGNLLKVGPFVVFERLAKLGYASVFRARQVDGDRFVRLSVAASHVDLDDAERRLALLTRKVEPLSIAPLVPVEHNGRDGERLWAASEYLSGRSARQWMLGHSRMPPLHVLEVARQMMLGLAVCERESVAHAGISADSLWFDASGQVRLPEPGLRGVLLPKEDARQPEMPAEAYDYLAPERTAEESLADSRSDAFSCGALWWHLLVGRPPFAGSTAAAKLRLAQNSKLPDVRQFVPDTPEVLAENIMSCLCRAPEKRPESLAALAAALGEPTAKGQKQLAALVREETGLRRFRIQLGELRRLPRKSTWVAAAVGVVLAITMIAWPAIAQRMNPQAASKASGRRTHKPIIKATTEPRKPAGATRHDFSQATDRSQDSVVPTTQIDVAEVAEGLPAPIDNIAANALAPAAMEQGDRENEQNEFRSTKDVTAVDWQQPDEVLEVSADDPPIDLASLQPGQTLRGDPERRPTMELPPEGIELLQSGITIENIDFVARQPLASGAAMLSLQGSNATLAGCSFQTAGEISATEYPPAIRWVQEAEQANGALEPSTGELQIRDVTFRRVTAGITCSLSSNNVIRFINVLCLETSAAVQIDRFPAANERAFLGFSSVTLRGARSLVEVGCEQIPESLGELEIESVDCAFALPGAGALLIFAGESRPGPLLQGFRWSGLGSILSSRSRLALWRTPTGRLLAAADEAVPIEGVVRGELSFAGPIDDAPGGSGIVRWQGPLSSQRTPGIDDSRLSLPTVND